MIKKLIFEFFNQNGPKLCEREKVCFLMNYGKSILVSNKNVSKKQPFN